uniref:Methyl-CpG-binding domain-containing protein n=1 Tax=Junco hyemalis TaxID=40217 RepID=A0A8C5J7H2_JUNHY
MDLGTFDFRTGKMLMNKMNKNRQRMRYDCSNQAKGKPDLNTALPVRQTASIFKQPVTKITNHPSNKVKSDPQKAVDQPRQLFWEKKLSGLNAFDIAEELVKTMDLPKGLQGNQRVPFTQGWHLAPGRGSEGAGGELLLPEPGRAVPIPWGWKDDSFLTDNEENFLLFLFWCQEPALCSSVWREGDPFQQVWLHTCFCVQ